MLKRLDIMASKYPADSPKLEELKYSNLAYLLDSPFLSNNTLPGFSNRFIELLAPKNVSKNPLGRSASFSSSNQFKIYMKYFRQFPRSKGAMRFLTKIEQAEMDYFINSFFSAEDIMATDFELFTYLIESFPDLVQWDDLLGRIIFSDKLIPFLAKENKISTLIEMIEKHAKLQPPEKLNFLFGVGARLEQISSGSDILNQSLIKAANEVFSSPTIPTELSSVNFLLSLRSYLTRQNALTPKLASYLVNIISKSRSPNLEVLLDLLKNIIGGTVGVSTPQQAREFSQKKSFYLKKIKYHFEKNGLTVQENKSLGASIVPLFCPELAVCVFVTSVGSNDIKPEDRELARESMQTVFDALVGQNKALIFDLSDFENEDTPVDLDSILAEMKEMRNKENSQEKSQIEVIN